MRGLLGSASFEGRGKARRHQTPRWPSQTTRRPKGRAFEILHKHMGDSAAQQLSSDATRYLQNRQKIKSQKVNSVMIFWPRGILNTEQMSKIQKVKKIFVF